MPICSKAQMYALLSVGVLGNTIPRWFTFREWQERTTLRNQNLWGVQHATIAGFPGTRLNVPTGLVASVIATNGFGKDYVISPMVSEWGQVIWEGNIAWMTDGLLVEGHAYPTPGSWRQHMLNPQQWRGCHARVLLETVLNENSLEDLLILRDAYPDHVIELSAMEGHYGTIPGRNAIIWEVRQY